MKKTGLILLLIPMLFALLTVPFSAQSVDEILDKTEEETDYRSFLEAIPEECNELFESWGIDLSSQAPAPDLEKLFLMLLGLLWGVISEYFPLLTIGIGLILLFRLITTICHENSRLVESLGYLAVISSGIYSFSVIERLLACLTTVTEQCASFLTAALPVIGAAQIWSGSQSSATILSATLPVILTILSSAVSSVFYPLCWFCYAASLSGFYRDRVSLRPLVSSVKKFCTRGVEILSGLSVGVFCVQRAAIASADSVARRGVRFALVQMIPMAGGSLTEGMEIIYACGKSISGRIGVIAVLSLAALYATPCILGFFFVFLFSFLSSAGTLPGASLLTDFFADVKDTFSMMTGFAVCSLVVLSSALLLLTGG